MISSHQTPFVKLSADWAATKGVSNGASAWGVNLARWRRWPLCQSRVAECAVTRFYTGVNTRSHILITKKKFPPTYIPNNHVSWPPFHANLEILPEGNMIVQELQQEIAFLLLVSDNVSGD